jgi:MerR family transcriptional regulator, thiopeptide resistance regulator
LLNPSGRDPSNDYRRYDFADMLRLQQILFFRELDISLKKIKRILDDPSTDRLALLQQHHESLERRVQRLQSLQGTIEKTIQNLKEEGPMPLTDKELYEGFDKETIERYNREAREIYDPELVTAVDHKVRNLSKAQWWEIQDEGSAIAEGLAELIDHKPVDPAVQVFITRLHSWVENFYPAPASVFQGLGVLYSTHAEFRAYYDKYAPNLADFMKDAMNHFAAT